MSFCWTQRRLFVFLRLQIHDEFTKTFSPFGKFIYNLNYTSYNLTILLNIIGMGRVENSAARTINKTLLHFYGTLTSSTLR